jgi:hypothetical protein
MERVRAHKPAILEALAAADEAARAACALEHRRVLVLRHLATRPELARAFDVQDAPLTAGEPGPAVSVVLAIRAPGGGIVTGELHVPRERFDAAAFVAALEPTLH